VGRTAIRAPRVVANTRAGSPVVIARTWDCAPPCAAHGLLAPRATTREDVRMREMRERSAQPSRPGGHAASDPAPGKHTLVEVSPAVAGAGASASGAFPVQRKGGGDGAGVHTAAQQGIAGPGGGLPHGETIQRLFGRHDVSGIQAHTDGAARQATAQMGAAGFATGHHVAFAGTPDLHLAAHEAAHVVQQRAGVQLAGGVGAADDAYERHADAVADRVVAGRSAEDLLPGGSGGGGAQLQHKPAHAGHDAGHHADHDAAHADADAADDHDAEADDSDEQASAHVPLTAGKPPGNVQMKSTAPRAEAARAPRPLTIQEATARYAPLVFLAPGETHRPSDASNFIHNSRLRWSHDSGQSDDQIADQGHVDEQRLGDGGYSDQVENVIGIKHGDHIRSNQDVRPKDGKGDGGDEGFFLDLDNAHHESTGPGTNMPVYYEAVAGHYITYWFFYAYNAGPAPGGVDNHEGDWERISVKLNRHNRATAVAYFQHKGHEVKRWREVPRQGSHPTVFSAKGSHASYASPGKKDIGVPLNAVQDHAGRGAKWKTWQHLKNARAQDWYGYGGAWGEVGNYSDTTGPQGPSRYKPPAPKGW
jgi:hypothetical protein